jgi:hypothetical protein
MVPDSEYAVHDKDTILNTPSGVQYWIQLNNFNRVNIHISDILTLKQQKMF